MRARDSLSLIAICAALCSVVLLIFLAQAEGRAQQPPRTASEGGPYKNDLQQQKAPARIFNTAKQKLRKARWWLVRRCSRPTRTFIARWPTRDTTTRGSRCSTAR